MGPRMSLSCFGWFLDYRAFGAALLVIRIIRSPSTRQELPSWSDRFQALTTLSCIEQASWSILLADGS